jgi:hypothetical protein
VGLERVEVDNNYLDLGMSKSRFIHTLPSGRLTKQDTFIKSSSRPSKQQLPTIYIALSIHFMYVNVHPFIDKEREDSHN